MKPHEYRNATNIGLDYIGADDRRMTTCQLVNSRGTAIATADFADGRLVGHGKRPEVDFMLFIVWCSILIRDTPSPVKC